MKDVGEKVQGPSKPELDGPINIVAFFGGVGETPHSPVRVTTTKGVGTNESDHFLIVEAREWSVG